jgi:hypothetical protein
VIAKDIGPDVGLGRSLQFGMPELEDDLGLADWETVLVRDPAAQNEGVVVEAEVIRVDKQHFADFYRLLQEAFGRVFHAVLFSRLAHGLAEVKQALSRMEFVGPQKELAADVFGRMDGHAIGVLARLELGDAAHPTGGNWRAILWWRGRGFSVLTANCGYCCGWHVRPPRTLTIWLPNSSECNKGQTRWIL